jgi:small-conductance mechanosensitive channel
MLRSAPMAPSGGGASTSASATPRRRLTFAERGADAPRVARTRSGWLDIGVLGALTAGLGALRPSGWLAGESAGARVLQLNVGPGANSIVDYVRFALAFAALFTVWWWVETSVRAFALETEREIILRREQPSAGGGGAVGGPSQAGSAQGAGGAPPPGPGRPAGTPLGPSALGPGPGPGRGLGLGLGLGEEEGAEDEEEEEPTRVSALGLLLRGRFFGGWGRLLMMDVVLVKVLLVLFPAVPVARMSMRQAVKHAHHSHKAGLLASPSGPGVGDAEDGKDKEQLRRLRRHDSASVLQFHRNVRATHSPLSRQAVALSSLVVLTALAAELSLQLDDWVRLKVQAALHAALVVRLLVPVATAAREIVGEALPRMAGGSSSGGGSGGSNSSSSPASPTSAASGGASVAGTDGILANSWGVIAHAAQLGVWVATVIYFFQALGFDMSSYVAGLGISSIAAAFAAQRTLAEVFATAALLADRPFGIGDLIVFRDIEARVLRIGFRSTHLATTYSGEELVVPNIDLVASHVLNRTNMENRRVKCRIIVALDNAPEQVAKVEAILQRCVEAAPKATFIYAHCMEITLHGAAFEYVFRVPGSNSKDYKDAQHCINIRLLEELYRAKITLARPGPLNNSGSNSNSGGSNSLGGSSSMGGGGGSSIHSTNTGIGSLMPR